MVVIRLLFIEFTSRPPADDLRITRSALSAEGSCRTLAPSRSEFESQGTNSKRINHKYERGKSNEEQAHDVDFDRRPGTYRQRSECDGEDQGSGKLPFSDGSFDFEGGCHQESR
jgi:hypothetical protein